MPRSALTAHGQKRYMYIHLMTESLIFHHPIILSKLLQFSQYYAIIYTQHHRSRQRRE